MSGMVDYLLVLLAAYYWLYYLQVALRDIIDVQLQPSITRIRIQTVKAPPSSVDAPWLTSKKNLRPKTPWIRFTTFSSGDAQDAIDNLDMNELKRKILKVNLARPIKTAAINPQSNRAGAWANFLSSFCIIMEIFPRSFQFGNRKNGCRSM